MKVLTGILLTLVLSVMAVSLVEATAHMHGHHMPNGCHTAATTVVCPVSVGEHIAAWKAVFLAVMPLVVSLLILLVGVRLPVWPYWTNAWTQAMSWGVLDSVATFMRQLRERTYQYTVRPWQELFARGVLHSKAY